MNYNAIIYSGNDIIDELETNEQNEFFLLDMYPTATSVVYVPYKMSEALCHKINNTKPSYVSGVDSDGCFFVEYVELTKSILEKLIAISNKFGYDFRVYKGNKMVVSFIKN